jgi:hypothetical protein
MYLPLRIAGTLIPDYHQTPSHRILRFPRNADERQPDIFETVSVCRNKTVLMFLFLCKLPAPAQLLSFSG